MRGSANGICVQFLDLSKMSISICPICHSKNKAFANPGRPPFCMEKKAELQLRFVWAARIDDFDICQSGKHSF